MRTKMQLFASTVLGMCLLTATTAFAMPYGKTMCPHQCGMSGCMMYQGKISYERMFFGTIACVLGYADELGLTAEQKETLTTKKYEVEKNLIQSKADLEVLGLDIRRELAKDTIMVDTVNGLIDKKYALKAQNAKDLVAAYNDVTNTLTSDQNKKFKELCAGNTMAQCPLGTMKGPSMMAKEGKGMMMEGRRMDK